ncbi:uncharacterized protein EAF01_002501 [Botrytis porri]|uniref:uncharacterized protein n=1 Tax=Botrytis porri TaxID=87229 RepID=UPI0018FFFAB4|nr:uncharacterized protein EAF01_002501 [Botrytis porri]KAF7910993.1 hypothetical protein EAF01_002501 [Botrytis porri]
MVRSNYLQSFQELDNATRVIPTSSVERHLAMILSWGLAGHIEAHWSISYWIVWAVARSGTMENHGLPLRNFVFTVT